MSLSKGMVLRNIGNFLDGVCLASVGLRRVSVPHDRAEIACNYLMLFPAFSECYLWDMRYAHWGELGVWAISESHEGMDLTPRNGSSVIFLLFRAIAVFILTYSFFPTSY